MKRRAAASPDMSSQPAAKRARGAAGEEEDAAFMALAPEMTSYGAGLLTHQIEEATPAAGADADKEARDWKQLCGSEANAQAAVKAAVRYVVLNFAHSASKMITPAEVTAAVAAETGLKSIPGATLLQHAAKPLSETFSLEILPAWATLKEPNEMHDSGPVYVLKKDRAWVVRPRAEFVVGGTLGARLAVGDLSGKAVATAETTSRGMRGLLLFVLQALTLAPGQCLSETELVEALTPLVASGLQVVAGAEPVPIDPKAALRTFAEQRYLTSNKAEAAADAAEGISNTGVRAALAASGVVSAGGSGDKGEVYRVGPRARMCLGVFNTLSSVATLHVAADSLARAAGKEPVAFDWKGLMGNPKRLERALGSEGLHVKETLEQVEKDQKAAVAKAEAAQAAEAAAQAAAALAQARRRR